MLEFIGLCVIALAAWFFWNKKQLTGKKNRASQSVANRQDPIIADDMSGPVIKRTAPDQVELNLDPLEMTFEVEPDSFDDIFTEAVEADQITAELDAELNTLQAESADIEEALPQAEYESVITPTSEYASVITSEVMLTEDMSTEIGKSEEDDIKDLWVESDSVENVEGKVIAFAVMSQVGRELSGDTILALFSDLDLTFVEGAGFYLKLAAGDMQNPLFTVANMVTPGTFEPTSFVAETTPGLLLFTRLEKNDDAWDKFTAIVEAAEALTEQLDGVLCDEQHKAISASRMVEIQNEVATLVADYARA